MTRPDDIPEDAWDVANAVMQLYFHGTNARNQDQWDAYVLIAASAILADRAQRSALAQPSAPEGWGRAVADIAAERRRQVEAEGWTPEHDDKHDRGEMALAAACYALCAASPVKALRVSIMNAIHWIWPWGAQWWKPAGRRRNLIKAGALIAAEIDRLDRAMLAARPLPPAPTAEEV